MHAQLQPQKTGKKELVTRKRELNLSQGASRRRTYGHGLELATAALWCHAQFGAVVRSFTSLSILAAAFIFIVRERSIDVGLVVP